MPKSSLGHSFLDLLFNRYIIYFQKVNRRCRIYHIII